MSPSVVDTNCMKYFQQERVRNEYGNYTSTINKLFEIGFIAIDDSNHALTEYYGCCQPSAFGINLSDWISDQLISRKIIMVSPDFSIKNDLKKIGLPQKDIKWPCIAKGAQADLLLTEDIDLFDPTEKRASASRKDKIKRDRTGAVCRFLERKHGIKVVTSTYIIDNL